MKRTSSSGLWQLFHIMSVGVVEYNKHHHHGSLDDLIATRYASETLRNCKFVVVYFCAYHLYLLYLLTSHLSSTVLSLLDIDHFFQCDVCRMNFLSMYDTCAVSCCMWKSLNLFSILSHLIHPLMPYLIQFHSLTDAIVYLRNHHHL